MFLGNSHIQCGCWCDKCNTK